MGGGKSWSTRSQTSDHGGPRAHSQELDFYSHQNGKALQSSKQRGGDHHLPYELNRPGGMGRSRESRKQQSDRR